MTVKELLTLCQEQVALGNGDKEIYVFNDNEGNGIHQLIYSFSETDEEVDATMIEYGMGYKYAPDKQILLG